MADDKKTAEKKPKRERNPFKGAAESMIADLLMRSELGDHKKSTDMLGKFEGRVYRLTVERLDEKK